MSEQKSSLFGSIISTISFGFIGSSIFALLLGIDSGSSFNLDTLFNSMNLINISNLNVYFAILFSWALGGLIGGIRAKDPTNGGLAGFFGSFLGGIIILLFFVIDDFNAILDPNNLNIDFSPIIDPLPGFLLGFLGIIIVASLLGFGAGRATYSPTKSKSKTKKAKKTWQDNKKWKCSKCGSNIPPGELSCPSCGAGVIQ